MASHPATLRVSLSSPTDFERCVHRYAAFGPDEANRLDEAGALRFVRPLDGARFLVTARKAGTRVSPGARIEVLGTVPPGREVLSCIREEVRWRLGARFDLPGFYRCAARDRVLAPIVQAFRGYRPPLAAGPFEAIVTSITAQQINLAFAFTTRSRFVRAYGLPLRTAEGDLYHAFPRPKDLAGARASRMRKMQFSGTKTRAILEFAREARRGNVPLSAMKAWEEESIRERLTAHFGIGRWTVDWFLSRGLGRPDAWPAGDLGVRKAVSWYYFDREDQTEETVRAFGERFGEHRNLAAHYLLMGWVREKRQAASRRR
jgi:3-methyladenine DNA glycosylase/8-oxoguanine DNA glycosylase